MLTKEKEFAIIIELEYAGIAQLVEQLICNQQVGGSSPSTSSTNFNFIWERSRVAKGDRL